MIYRHVLPASQIIIIIFGVEMKSVKVLATISLMAMLFIFPVEAAKLTGRISVQGGSVSGARVQVNCPSAGVTKNANIDNSGSYVISHLPNNQACQVSVMHNGQSSQNISVNLGSGTKVFNGLVRKHNNRLVLIQR
jgi:hypothetical protein